MLPSLSKQHYIFGRQRLCHPPSRITREELHRIAAGILRDNQRVVNSAFNWGMKSYLRHQKTIHRLHRCLYLFLCFLCLFVANSFLCLLVADLVHYAQHVSAENFADVGFTVAATQQLPREIW